MTSISTGQPDGPGQIAHEDERALQDPDQQRRTAVVVVGQLLAELGHPLVEDVLGHHDLAEIGVVVPGVHGARHPSSSGAPGRLHLIGHWTATLLLTGQRATGPSPADDLGHRHRGHRQPAAANAGPASREPRRWPGLARGPPPGPARRRPGPVGGGRRGATTAGWPAGPGARGRRPGRRRRRGRWPGGQLVEEIPLGGQQPGLAGQDRHHVAPGHGAAQREKLVADPVAPEPGVVVRRIAHRARGPGRGTGPASRTAAGPGSGGPARPASRPGRRAPPPAAG